MLIIEAHDMTTAELADLRREHNIVDRPGFVTTVRVRKIDGNIAWSMERMKEGYWRTLQSQQKKAETNGAAMV